MPKPDPHVKPIASRIAIDVGGTFTDVVSLNGRDGRAAFDKVPTTPADPQQGVLAGLAAAEVPLSEVDLFVHGTTLGLNALLTRNGARTGIITTAGFRDVYLLGRTNRTPMYDFRYRKPAALVERRHTLEVIERLDFEGRVLTEFDDASARQAAREVMRLGLEAVTVSFLHAYANPEHERRMGRILAELAPEVEVTLCSDLSREIREYERTSTGVLDAYIKPLVRGYLRALQGSLSARGFAGRFLMTRSGGGAMTAAAAQEAPVNLILSGPAGGVLGARWYARAAGSPDLITIDMGGTSLDASLIVNGEPLTYFDAEFESLPINLASLYIHTIGAGGGSLVWIDEGGHLQVGPASAGADPGPASYGRGADQATFTDAAVQVGYLGDDTALAGSLALDPDRARRSLEEPAERLGMNVDEVARGVLRLSTTKIVGAVRAITVELGHDPADFTLLAFGGGGGLVACDVARELSIGTVVVPPGPGAFCAFGMLMADVRHDYARTRIGLIEDTPPEELEADVVQMGLLGERALAADGFPSDAQEFLVSLDLRYVGQEHSVQVPVTGSIDGAELGRIMQAFSHTHERAYGHVMPDPVEVVAVRCSAVGRQPVPEPTPLPGRTGEDLRSRGARSVVLVDGSRHDYATFHRDDFAAGDVVNGPAVISEHTGTTVLHASDTARVGHYGEIIVTIGQGD